MTNNELQTLAETLTEDHQAVLRLARKLEALRETMPVFSPGRTSLGVAASALRRFIAETL